MSFCDPTLISAAAPVYVSASQQVPVASASPCFGNRVMVVLIKGSLEIKHLFFGWFVWKRARRAGEKKRVVVKQQIEPRLLWFHEILWFNKMDELSREL